MVKKKMRNNALFPILLLLIIIAQSCASRTKNVYHDQLMDFGSVKVIAVLPFGNLTTDPNAAERVRDVFITALLSSEAVYVLPRGEIRRGITRGGLRDAISPSSEEAVKLAEIIGADAVVSGIVKEYGEVRSGASTANVISISLQMIEAQTGKVVWTAATTKGGITVWDRLFGGGGEPFNDVTERAVDEILDKLFM